MSGITLAIALLPEEFPMVLAIFMALGAFRLARHKVLVRRAAVIETLGAATFLCVDKTGTLTENRMMLTTAWRGGEVQDLRGSGRLSGAAVEPLRTALLASAVRPVDPMDRAVRVLGMRACPSRPGMRPRCAPIRSVPSCWRSSRSGRTRRAAFCMPRKAHPRPFSVSAA